MDEYEFWAIVVICITIFAIINVICECIRKRTKYKYDYHDKIYGNSMKESDEDDN